jgi:hypothetical protein
MSDRTFDLGWGVARINADDTVTQTCKGCGASATSAGVRKGNTVHVAEAALEHGVGCPVWRAGVEARYLGRN